MIIERASGLVFLISISATSYESSGSESGMSEQALTLLVLGPRAFVLVEGGLRNGIDSFELGGT